MSNRRVLQVKPQVDRSIYFGPRYMNPARFASYAYQIREILALGPKNVLEVGIGNGLVSYMLRQAGTDVTTLDFDESLQPDIVGSVAEMPIADGSFDLVVCCEVLEHIPYEMFCAALNEIFRVAVTSAVISLPEHGRFYKVEAVLPMIGRHRWSLSVPFLSPPEHIFDGEHHWEIGKNGYPLQAALAVMRSVGFSVAKTYRVWENPYHRVFLLRKGFS